MSMKDVPYIVHKYDFIPSFGVILDVQSVFAYIYDNPSLKAVASFTGIHDFLSNMCWDTSLGRQSDTWEYIETLEYQLMEQDVDATPLLDSLQIEPCDLAAAMRGLEDYLEKDVFKCLDKRTQNEFIHRGFCISKWIAPTQAIFETLTGQDVPCTDPRAVFRRRAFSDMGYAARV